MATVVFVHAHPDDEALLTAGTMRGLAQSGHRVVLIVATDGAAGLTSSELASNLGQTRANETAVSAAALGVATTHWLGYADSGLDGRATAEQQTLVQANLESAASRLAALFEQESADVVVGYDAAGGYGHPDHLRLHELVRRAADLHGTATVLEATIDRTLITRVLDVLRPVLLRVRLEEVLQLADRFAPPADIDYCVDVRRWLGPKRGSMRAHRSQSVGGKAPRTLQLLLALPRPLFRLLLGREWYHVVREAAGNPIAALPQRIR